MLSADGVLRSTTLLLVVPAVVFLAAALAQRRAIGVAPAVFLLGTAYGVWVLVEEDSLDLRAPFVAAGLFALAELSYWSLELHGAVGEEPGGHIRRLGLLAGLTLGALVLGVALLALVDVVETGGVAVLAAGVAAAVAALALLALTARRSSL